MKHPFTVSAAAAARLLIMAARISSKAVILVSDVIEGRIDLDSCSPSEFGAEGSALVDALRKAILRSQRARQAARARQSTSLASTEIDIPAAPPVEPPFEMRRTSRGMEKFYRWPDRSWRRTPPAPGADCRRTRRHGGKSSSPRMSRNS